MATDPRSRVMTLAWSQDGKRGTVKLALGTMDYLGLPLNAGELAEVNYSVGSKSITRRMYPGGPTLQYNRPEQTITRTVGGNVSRARTDSKLVLATHNSTDTIYYTGPQNEFLKWFLARVQGAEQPVRVLTPKGNPLGVIDRRVPLDLV